MFFTLLSTSILGDVFAEDTRVFPCPDVRIGMSAQDLLDKERYSAERINLGLQFLPLEEKISRLLQYGGTLDYDISGNKFWDNLSVRIDGDMKVKYISYGNSIMHLLVHFMQLPPPEEGLD